MAATVQNTLNQINNTLRNSKEGPYSNYSCKTVSWDDVQRGTVGSNLSCWGSNITDTRLYAKDGRKLFTVRGNNWNERLGKVSSSDVALVATPDPTDSSVPPQPFTLREVLSRSSEFGKYAGLNEENISKDVLDKDVSIRFQTTFLPVDLGEKTSLEFAPEAYNYNTNSDHDPKNLIFLCTSQGLAIQQDGHGSKRLYHHAVDNDGCIRRHWLEAESSNHKVGGCQVETKQEKEDAIKRGKATSSVIGVKSIGTRFNVLMTIQIPLEQKVTRKECYEGTGLCLFGGGGDEEEEYDFCYEEECMDDEEDEEEYCASPSPKERRCGSITYGHSSTARVSRGSYEDTWDGLTVDQPKRHENEHITATIVLYYTCAGGVPTEQDVKAAIDDLEELYHSVKTNGLLSEGKFNFMKSELTVKDVIDIETKLVTQPPKSPAPINFDVFPV